MIRLGKLSFCVLACLLLYVPLASAATRYAAPGGTGTDPCADPNAACSLYTAADVSAPGTTVKAGDVIELLPGTYSEAAGDLGPFDSVAINEVTVRGASSESVPLIRLQENNSNLGAFQVNEGSLISHLEIENQDDGGYAVSLFDGGTMERSVVRAPDGLSTACNVVSGTIRSSACINEGGGAALGASIGTIGQTFTVVIRNSTAIATGSGSVGVEFNYGAMTEGLVANIDAKGLIAKGISKDVVAKGKETSASGKGAKTTITLDTPAMRRSAPKSRARAEAPRSRRRGPTRTSPRRRSWRGTSSISFRARRRSAKARSTPNRPHSTSTASREPVGWDPTSAPTSWRTRRRPWSNATPEGPPSAVRSSVKSWSKTSTGRRCSPVARSRCRRGLA